MAVAEGEEVDLLGMRTDLRHVWWLQSTGFPDGCWWQVGKGHRGKLEDEACVTERTAVPFVQSKTLRRGGKGRE